MEIKTILELPQELKTDLKNNANIFFQYTFAEYVHQNSEELYFVYDDERVVPVRLRLKGPFNLGVLVSEPYVRADNPITTETEFLDAVVEKVSKEKHVQWMNTTASCFFKESPSKKCKRIPFGSHVIDLRQPEDILFSKMHSMHRRNIRKGLKESIVIKKGGSELLDDYVLLEKLTQERTGRVASGSKYYGKQIASLQDDIILYIAYKDNIPQAGGIFYWNKQMCYYMYGATRGRDGVAGSHNLLFWTAIKDMKAAGVKEFSFVGCRINEDPGSKYSGIQAFKGRFGGELRGGDICFATKITPLCTNCFVEQCN